MAQPLLLLLIEDSRTFAVRAEAMLSHRGYQVAVAGTAATSGFHPSS